MANMQNRVTVTLTQAAPLVIALLKAGIPTNLLGSPGLGKSDLIKSVAKQLNLKVIDVRLSTCDPTDLTGLPSIIDGRSVWSPNTCFPLADQDTVPEGYAGWLLFLDEITNAPMAVQAAAYKLILDREVGQFKLHDNVFIASAGNLTTDAAAVTGEMSTALKSRMAHINIEVSHEAWLAWAESPAVNVDYRITAYIRFKREQGLYNFDPQADTDTYACPRSWGMAAKIIDEVGYNSPMLLDLLGSVVSPAVALEFMTFVKYYADLPTLEQILKDPENVPFPTDRGPQYALSGLLSANLNREHGVKIIKATKRLPAELQAATAMPAFTRDATICAQPEIEQWIRSFVKDMYNTK